MVQKSEKECEVCEEGKEQTSRLLWLAAGDRFGVARREAGVCGRRMVDFGSEISDENMKHFTTNIHAVSSQMLVTIRIEAEVIESIGVGIVEIRERRWSAPSGRDDEVLPPAK